MTPSRESWPTATTPFRTGSKPHFGSRCPPLRYENYLTWPSRVPAFHGARTCRSGPPFVNPGPSNRQSGSHSRHLYVVNASQMGPNCGVWVREVSLVIGRAGQLHGGAGPEYDTPHLNSGSSEQIPGRNGPHLQVWRPASSIIEERENSMEEQHNKRVAGIDVSKARTGSVGWRPGPSRRFKQQREGDRGAGGMAGTPWSEPGSVRAYGRVRAGGGTKAERERDKGATGAPEQGAGIGTSVGESGQDGRSGR